MIFTFCRAIILTIFWGCICCFAYSSPLATIAPRIEKNFSTQWLYTPKDISSGESLALKDSNFERVSVPHANILTPGETFDPDMFRFVSWYRKHFRPDASWENKLVVARFQGVMTVADVFLNGKHLMQHKGGYTSFDVDLTPALKFGGDNVIAVRVDSRVQREIPPEGQQPKMFGFYLFGGIQRDITLRITDKLHIEQVYYVTDRILPEAEIGATIAVRNGRPVAVDALVRVRIRDSQGQEAGAALTKVELKPGEVRDVHIDVPSIAHPKLWHPDHPDRYIADAEVSDGLAVTDRELTWIGIRQLDWEGGVLHINGKPFQMRGLSRHQTFPFIGGAVPNRLQRRDALTLKYGLGVNATRSAPYPPDPDFLDECDRLGLLIMDETPGFQFAGDAEWQNNFIQATREMILRDRNHPSVFVWGVRPNETSGNENDDRDFYTRTYALAKELDPSRSPGGARFSGGWHGKIVPEEVLTINDYEDFDDPTKFPQKVTDLPWVISEFGHPQQIPVWEGEDVLLSNVFRWMRHYNELYAHPEISGAIGWAAFDYNSPEFNTPVAVTAYHCVEDIYRLPKGFAAYAIASQRDPDLYGPMVHILHYWRRTSADLWVASNAEEVEIKINGKSLGRQKGTEFTSLPHPLFKFSLGDAFQIGTVEALAYRHGEVVAHEQLRTPEEAQKLVIIADDASIVGDGADATRVVVYAQDRNGTVPPYEDRGIKIQVENGTLLGMPTAHLEGGRIAFYVQAKEGQRQPISIHVSAEGLEVGHAEVSVEAGSADAVPYSPFDSRIESLKFVPVKR
jgi:beta-galactosidase